jgi:D-lactate dehydrogenase
MTSETLPETYRSFLDEIRTGLPAARIFTDPLHALAYGTDASFYRLIPKIVVKARDEAEVAFITANAARRGIHVTFRAAGTSLSGQAISDSVLVIAGGDWNRYEILDEGERIRLQPGVVGSHANRYLLPYDRKIGPDPASINAAMIGGIAANNASGMCCGISQNSYQTISSMRIVFVDGTVLDTADAESRAKFVRTHAGLIDEIGAIRDEITGNRELAERIRHKYKIKNTTGYSLNAFVDFEDPLDIILHLMIGSEGTLGFISEVVFNTVVEHPDKASALIIFPQMEAACSAASILKEQPVAAAELMDRAALRSVQAKDGMPGYLKTLSEDAAALLVETRAYDTAELGDNIRQVLKALRKLPTERPIEFTDRVAEYTGLWNIRKGLFPAVGAVRDIGTTVIIEDVAFPIASLAPATLDLQKLMQRFHYHEAIIFGHAREGNLHFVFTQDFNHRSEVERYSHFMQDVCEMVVQRYDGSLKAEHGTGRNMAPYVELEWGAEAFQIMQRVKNIFDPGHLLNPGVIVNSNPQAHIENLKPLPETNPLLDKCIECGFCEVNCPSKDLTLTPRQRIVIQREISRLRMTGEDNQRLRQLERDYVYQGERTCAVDGLCAVSCPVAINTGEHTKQLRGAQRSPLSRRLADLAADHFGGVEAALRLGLRVSSVAQRWVGPGPLEALSGSLHRLSDARLPQWNRYMPRNGSPLKVPVSRQRDRVVYFPSCVSRATGPAMGDPDVDPLHAVTVRVLDRAGYDVIYPEPVTGLCCGTPFESKGFFKQADRKSKQLENALLTATHGGRLPVLCDTSPCLYRMRKVMSPLLKMYEPGEFITRFLLARLNFEKLSDPIALHHTCSNIKMGLENHLEAAARACSREVIVPELVGCCGFAGDRGFNYPELNASALKALNGALGPACEAGYSTSRTCEIGLSRHSGVFYKSIFYLVDRCTSASPNIL